jgi:hypothetical protein
VVGGLVLAGLGGLDVCVNRARDGQVGALGLVLVDDGRSLTVVSHPRHQIPELFV